MTNHVQDHVDHRHLSAVPAGDVKTVDIRRPPAEEQVPNVTAQLVDVFCSVVRQVSLGQVSGRSPGLEYEQEQECKFP